MERTLGGGPAGRRVTLPVWKRLLFAGVITSLVFSVPEAICRWTDWERRLFPGAFVDPFESSPSWAWQLLRYDPVTFWSGRPHALLPGTEERLTGRGLRAPDFPDTKAPGTMRIVCMGDSSTFGFARYADGLRGFHPTYAEVLQAILNNGAGRRVEVINAGVLGYTTLNGLRQLDHVVRRWRPDVVTLRYGVNDYLRYFPVYRLAYEPRSPLLRGLQRFLLDQQSFQLLIRFRDLRFIKGHEDAVRVADEFPSGPQIPPAEYEFNLRCLVERARAIGARVVLLTAPLEPAGRGNPTDEAFMRASGYRTYDELAAQHARYADIVRRVAADLGVPLVDSIRLMTPRGLEHYFTGHDLFHPSGAGHIAIAEDLAATLRAEGLVP